MPFNFTKTKILIGIVIVADAIQNEKATIISRSRSKVTHNSFIYIIISVNETNFSYSTRTYMHKLFTENKMYYLYVNCKHKMKINSIPT